MRAVLGLIVLALLASSWMPSTQVAAQVAAETTSDDTVFYRVYPDPRLCPSPICGGAWVQEVNRTLTRCADGELRERCYVAEVDSSALRMSAAEQAEFQGPFGAGQLLVRGRIEPKEYPGFGNLGVLRVFASWRPATDAAPAGTFYRVRDNGIRCITAPCFSYQAVAVNTDEETTLSRVDLSKVGATPAQLIEAQQLLANGGLLAAGTVESEPQAGPAGEGRVLVATQFYLPVAPRTTRVRLPVGRTRLAPTRVPTPTVLIPSL